MRAKDLKNSKPEKSKVAMADQVRVDRPGLAMALWSVMETVWLTINN